MRCPPGTGQPSSNIAGWGRGAGGGLTFYKGGEEVFFRGSCVDPCSPVNSLFCSTKLSDSEMCVGAVCMHVSVYVSVCIYVS